MVSAVSEESTPRRPTEAEVKDSIMYADAALDLAGHRVTDPALRALGDARIRGDMTGDEFSAEAKRRIRGHKRFDRTQRTDRG